MAWWIFISAVSLIGYAYLGYPIVCLVRAMIRPRLIARRAIRPRVSILIAAWREADTIGPKLESIAAQSYPRELLQVIIACDGSDDGTDAIARRVADRILPGRVEVLSLARNGKPAALNAALEKSTGEILVLTDARQRLSPDAVLRLVEDLGDETVGAVGGRLVLQGDAPVGAYWRYESLVRSLEGEAGSTVGVSGALYAIRRSLFAPIPEETILDDLLVPMRVRLLGLRVVFEPEAIVYDRAAKTGREFSRKVRTLSGNFQILLLAPALLSPTKNPAWFDFVSHKLARLLVPYALLIVLLFPLILPRPWSIATGLQILGYGLAGMRGVGLLADSRLAGLLETFVVLNVAAVAGFIRFVQFGRKLPLDLAARFNSVGAPVVPSRRWPRRR